MKVNEDSIHKSSKADHIYLVKSTVYVDKEYEVDTQKWTCTCTVGRTGYPSGEPCKHQHSVAKKYSLTAPNVLPYFNGEGRYLYALLALGQERVGDKSFYAGMKETIPLSNSSGPIESQLPQGHIGMDSVTYKEGEHQDMDFKDHDEGAENLDIMISIIEEQEELKKEVLALGSAFVEDVQERMKKMDTQYLTGLRRFFTVPYSRYFSGGKIFVVERRTMEFLPMKQYCIVWCSHT